MLQPDHKHHAEQPPKPAAPITPEQARRELGHGFTSTPPKGGDPSPR